MKKINKTKKVSDKMKKSTLTFFIMLFPALIMVSLFGNLPYVFYAILLFFYQSILIKNFLDDHYRNHPNIND